MEIIMTIPDTTSIRLLHELINAGFLVKPNTFMASLSQISNSVSALRSIDGPYAASVVDVASALIAKNLVRDCDELDLFFKSFSKSRQVPDIESAGGESKSIVPDLRPVSETGQQPAINIKLSVTPEYLVCLEDGVQRKTLKRHLMQVYGMTPDNYRSKWGLPRDYPMTAPNYSKKKSVYAHSANFGTFSTVYRRPREATKLH